MLAQQFQRLGVEGGGDESFPRGVVDALQELPSQRFGVGHLAVPALEFRSVRIAAVAVDGVVRAVVRVESHRPTRAGVGPAPRAGHAALEGQVGDRGVLDGGLMEGPVRRGPVPVRHVAAEGIDGVHGPQQVQQ